MKVWRSVWVAVGSIVGVRVVAGDRRGGVLNGVEHFMSGYIDAHLAQLFVPETRVCYNERAGGRMTWTHALQSSAFWARHCDR